jgi:hypothetical protein
MIRRLTSFAAALSFAVAPVLAAPTDGTASYVVNLGGINIASVDIELTDDGSTYRIDIDGNVSGLGSLVARGTAAMATNGSSANGRLAPQNFALETVADGEVFRVDVGYAVNDAVSFTVNPPLINSIDRVPIERKHLLGVTDALSAFLLRGDALDAGLCNHRRSIFTGLERFDIAMRFEALQEATSRRTGYQGPVVLCNIKYTPVAGHFTTSEITTALAQTDRILIWYAPLGSSGYFLPYRVLMTTSMGDLSMVLVGLKGDYAR